MFVFIDYVKVFSKLITLLQYDKCQILTIFLCDLQPKDFFNYQKEFITEAEMLVKQEELKKAEEERSKS